jgi:lysyl-tRNA synthetase class 1
LYAFSDDMDGLRKVPDNVPNREMVAEHLGKPLTSVPDPFGTHESFGHHMNARLRAFLDRFGFAYSFKSSTECYRSGLFDATLLPRAGAPRRDRARGHPILGAERAGTYSPFLPVSPATGRVLQVRIEETRPESGTVVFRDEDDTLVEVPVTGGTASSSGAPTGRCAGRRSTSTTRCPART